ncbi:transient receptor potential cation channel subfamily M member 8-like isoform X2 [Mytilus californianus]|uniref:transient receptor potential cation channel subfamily M member 8-like isoform X2 n=1 Tax=Mytilus californianus TaxID=6549 RepID=UPI00224638D8|nr:transient receptor potential cation channel subfamily M member 8-like isoform X2 [Mytilus californianus]
MTDNLIQVEAVFVEKINEEVIFECENEIWNEVFELEKEKENRNGTGDTKILKEKALDFRKRFPGLVLAVVGDSESFVPRPWNATAFTADLIDTLKKVKESWLIYRGKDIGISSFIYNAFEEDIRTNGTLATKLIAVKPKDEKILGKPNQQKQTTTGQSKESKNQLSFKLPSMNEKDWFNIGLIELLKCLSEKTTPLLSFITENEDSKQYHNELPMEIPVLLVVAEGDIETIHQVESSVESNIPVLLVKGSGKAADLLVDYLTSRQLTSEKTGLLKNNAPTLFGTIFTKSSFYNLEQRMKKIQENNHLITVYDVERADEITLEDTIVDAIIKGWSLKHIKDDQGDAIGKSHKLAPIMSEVLKDLCTNQVGDETKSTNVDYTIPDETYNTAINTSLYISDLTPPGTPEPAIEIILKHDENESSIETDTNAENKLINDNETLRATDGTAEETSTSDEKSNKLMEILQFSLEPGSLSLYFYIAYQYSQDPNREKYKTKNTQILLLEAIIADRVEYVSAMLQHGIVFNTEHFEGLYDETFRCEDCKAKDCRSMHAIHHRCDNSICNFIWCTCLQNCKKCNEKASMNGHSKHCVRHGGHIFAVGIELKVDVCLQARYLCQKLLNFNLIDATDTKEEDKEQVYYDLLAWALLGNKVELATVFWSKCKNQLLTAIMASSILKSMASNVESTKDKKLYGELMEHSKLFENRVIEMQNTLYEKREIETMDLMEIEDEILGMKVSPMVLAFENKMIDVIGHPCIQRRLNRIWYNFNPTDSPFSFSDGPNNLNIPASGAAAKWTDWFKNLYRFTESIWMEQTWLSPLMVFAVHYLFVFAVIVWFSAFVLTDLDIIGSVSEIGIYEWLLYIWLFADFCEEIIVPLIIRTQYKRSKHTLWFKLKRFVRNVWKVLTCLSYLIILSAVFMRIENSSSNHRITLRLYSLGLFTMYMRFLQCMIVHSYFGPKIIMIGEMLLELIKFVWIFIVFMMCTGVLYHANMYPSHFDMWSQKSVTYWRIWKIISLPYWQLYGELFLDEIQGDKYEDNVTCTFVEADWESNPDIERCVDYDWVVLLIAALYMLFTNLLLVNLIIALFTFRFEEVQQNSDRLWKFWRYSIITEFRRRYPVPLNLPLLPLRIVKLCRLRNAKLNCCKKPKVHCSSHTEREQTGNSGGKRRQILNKIQPLQTLHANRCLYSPLKDTLQKH